MFKLAKLALGTAVAAGLMIATTTPADAHDDAGVAIAAGIIGLGLGAAIASDHPDRAAIRGTVIYWNFLPPEELEALLHLYARVAHKTLRISLKTATFRAAQSLPCRP